jgi:HEAT repeat protein
MKKLFLALCLFSTPALAAPEDHSDRLLFLLNLIDQVPDVAQLAEAGVDPNGQALFLVAADPSLPRYPRARAAGLLGRYANAQARGSLARLLTESNDLEVRVQAIAGLSFQEGAAALPRLQTLLGDREPELRAAAIRGLHRINTPSARRLLEQHRKVEPEVWVKATIPNP